MTFYLKSLSVAALFVLAGCQGTPGQDSAVKPVNPDNDPCGATHYQNYIGKPLSAVRGLSLANPVRAIPHNSAVTMDFNINRLNFSGNVNDRIDRVYCG